MAVKISIVIPTYQRPQLLQRCINAVACQDFSKKDYEVIIVTDGPDQETHAMVRQYRSKEPLVEINCFSLSAKKGAAAARNAGWKAALGALIVFTDDDCIPDPGWIKNFYRIYRSNGENYIAFTGKIIVPRPAKPTDFQLNTGQLETADFVTANCACTKQTLQKVNGFDEEFTMAWREDSDLEFRLLKLGIPILKSEEAVVVHPARKAPWGVSLREQRKSMFNALLFKKHPALYKEKIRSYALWNYYMMILLSITILVALAFQKKEIAFACCVSWLILMILFIKKRLSNTSHSMIHVTEMIFTSLLIPFFSVFWNLYGAFKFKVLHL